MIIAQSLSDNMMDTTTTTCRGITSQQTEIISQLPDDVEALGATHHHDDVEALGATHHHNDDEDDGVVGAATGAEVVVSHVSLMCLAHDHTTVNAHQVCM